MPTNIRGALHLLDQFAKLLGKSEPNMARAEQLIQAMPHATEVYAPSTLARAIQNTPEGNLLGITPSEFGQLAVEPGNQLNPDRIEQYYQLLTQGNGDRFPTMPFLAVEQYPDEFAQVLGHDGRHRNLALARRYGEGVPFPVRLESFLEGKRSPYRIEGPSLVSEADEDEFLDLMSKPRFAGGGFVRGALSAVKTSMKGADEAEKSHGRASKRENLGDLVPAPSENRQKTGALKQLRTLGSQ